MMTHAHNLKSKPVFSLQTYSFGAASVLIGASLVLASTAKADEPQAPLQTVDMASQVLATEANTDDSQSDVTSPSEPAAATAQAKSEPQASSASSQGSTVPASSSANDQLSAGEVAYQQPEKSSETTLADQGYYDFTHQVPVKAEPKAQAETLFTFDEGDKSVYYDQTLTSDGYHWISYLGTAGQRRYLQLDEVANTPVNQSGQVTETSEPKPGPTPAADRSGDLSFVQDANGDFTILVSNVRSKNGLKAVKIPVWTQANGQDDLIWYDGMAQGDGTYKAQVKLDQHRSERGRYHAHLYFDEADGKTYGVATASHTVPEQAQADQSSAENQESAVLGQYTFTKEVAVKAEPRHEAETLFTFDETSVPIHYDRKLTADGYNWLSYTSYSGQRHYIQMEPSQVVSDTQESSAQQNPVEQKATVSVTPKTNGDFEVYLSDVTTSSPIQALNVAVWSDNQGQDDLVWYPAAKEADGRYKVAVQLADHKKDYGLYHIHVYANEADGKSYGLAAATTTVSNPALERTGRVEIVPQKNGDFDVVISDVSAKTGVKAVRVPAWSDDQGQDDLIWYQALKQADGSYKASVKLANHKGQTGLYQVHVYYDENDGKTYGLAAKTTQVAPATQTQSLPKAGTYTFTQASPIRNHPNPAEPSELYYEAGQDVHYDSLLEENGYQWLSYVNNAGQRRYVAINQIEQTKDEADVSAAPTSLPESGSYRFTTTVDVKDSPDTDATTEFQFFEGESINYDRLVTADGHDWLSYQSRSGIRRYIAIN